MVISLFSSVFLTQPIQVFCITFILVAIFRKTNESDDMEVDSLDNGDPVYYDKSLKYFNANSNVYLRKTNFFLNLNLVFYLKETKKAV